VKGPVASIKYYVYRCAHDDNHQGYHYKYYPASRQTNDFLDIRVESTPCTACPRK
jgi:hypothetical protein